MYKHFLAALIFSSLLLSACTGSASQAENAGKSLAETSCLALNETVAIENVLETSEAIPAKYGFEDGNALNEYLTSIAGTEDQNLVVVSLRENLEKFCGDELSNLGITPADLAEEIIQ